MTNKMQPTMFILAGLVILVAVAFYSTQEATAADNKKTNPTGALMGAAAAGVLLLVALVLGIFKYKQQMGRSAGAASAMSPDTGINPDLGSGADSPGDI